MLPAITAEACAQDTPQSESQRIDQEEPGRASRLTLSGEAAIVSDYRFRGLSLSDEDVAVQGGLALSHDTGLYLSAWSSTIQETAGGADIELDIAAGYATELASGVGVDAGVVWYFYPGDSSVDYGEAYGSVSLTRGNLTPTIGIAYAPSQSALGDQDNLYIYGSLDAAVADTPLTLHAGLGYEDGALDAKENGGKVDWQLGASYALGPATLAVSYVDTNTRLVGGDSGTRNLADATVVASLSVSF